MSWNGQLTTGPLCSPEGQPGGGAALGAPVGMNHKTGHQCGEEGMVETSEATPLFTSSHPQGIVLPEKLAELW